MPDNGFLVVASRSPHYVTAANIAGGSIKDHYPEAHVTLFVPEYLLPYVDQSSFDLIVTEGVPDHTRTKLYALSRTPYTNLTVYVDADMECMHENVKDVWNEIDGDTDILITKIRPYNGKISKWPKGEFIYHGGFFMYRSNPQTLNFMARWWDDYQVQRREWPYDEKDYPKDLQQWDQFTLWKLMNLDKLPVTVKVFNDDAKWNFVNGYFPSETKSEIIFWHHTLPSRREYEL